MKYCVIINEKKVKKVKRGKVDSLVVFIICISHLIHFLIEFGTLGNLVYVGSQASFIRSLMIGKVSEITGAAHEPRYETMFLQGERK